MATKSRRRNTSVTQDLITRPWDFRFLQAVRLIELWAAREGASTKAGASAIESETIRFRTELSLDFPASEITSLTPADLSDDRDAPAAQANRPFPLEMTVAFMGLTGPSGVMPYHYTEMLIERQRVFRDDTAHSFFDIFNHRIISLFYRAWEKYRFYIPYERGDRGEGSGLTRNLLDFVGLGASGLQGRMREGERGLNDETLIFYAGHFAQRPHSASSLAAILADHFGVPAAVEQFQGQWLTIGDHDLTRLGQANHCLGVSGMLGSRVWDRQSRCRVRLGPLTRRQFDAFLPSGERYHEAQHLIRFHLGVSVDFDLQLVLDRREVPKLRVAPPGHHGARLGWTSWLLSRPPSHHAEDAIFPAIDKGRNG